MSLSAPLRDGEVRLESLGEGHREGLRQACAEDPGIWSIYPISFVGDAFDPNFDACLAGRNAAAFAVFHGDRLVGMTSYLGIDEANRSLEIGRTYIAPTVRGTDFNRRMKRLMLDRAFAEGFARVELRVDTRNTRSIAAVEKLGAVHEGTLRRNRVTWTGFVRDTAIYAILADEWSARGA
jgi:RimJ/RimL family protein N-acetyltransferase